MLAGNSPESRVTAGHTDLAQGAENVESADARHCRRLAVNRADRPAGFAGTAGVFIANRKFRLPLALYLAYTDKNPSEIGINMKKEFFYSLTMNWTGNTGRGTEKYNTYERSYTLEAPGKPDIYGSSDPAFRGDKTCWNPEELLLASLASCHMLWYLHLCAEAQIVVTAYEDHPTGNMLIETTGSGRFQEVVLNPIVKITCADQSSLATNLHKPAHEKCFIANSVNFPILIKATVK
jgi:organic hydroperoxide reductase OsmC/OhrA